MVRLLQPVSTGCTEVNHAVHSTHINVSTVGAAIAIYGKVCVGLLPSQHMIFTLTTVIVNLAGLVTMLMIFISHMNIIYT